MCLSNAETSALYKHIRTTPGQALGLVCIRWGPGPGSAAAGLPAVTPLTVQQMSSAASRLPPGADSNEGSAVQGPPQPLASSHTHSGLNGAVCWGLGDMSGPQPLYARSSRGSRTRHLMRPTSQSPQGVHLSHNMSRPARCRHWAGASASETGGLGMLATQASEGKGGREQQSCRYSVWKCCWGRESTPEDEKKKIKAVLAKVGEC